MLLNDNELKNRDQWEQKRFFLPRFDRAAVRERTRKDPVWLHIGAGNIFRSFLANIQQRLLNESFYNKGIVVAEGYDYEIIDAAYTAHDDLSVLVTLKSDGRIEKTVIASVVESLKTDASGFPRMKEIFAAGSLQIVSMTITEKGYNLSGADGSLLPDIVADTTAGPDNAKSFMGKLAALCYHRYLNGAAPLALVSMDNCSQNGTRLYEAVRHFANGWVQNGFADSGFLEYVDDPDRLSFPWSMIDKITPRPNDDVARILKEDGIDNADNIVTTKTTYIAPFVNAEETEYLVIEDAFPNGRPPLEKAGVIFTDRKTVEKTEKMKVCTCLNPLHTALAVFGCLFSYTRISEAMEDALLVKLVRRIAGEGLPVVVDPGILSPDEFVDTVITKRLPNPYIPDTPQRIATDTSAKIPVRFGETIKAYIESDTVNTESLVAIPLVLAGWLRYLLGVSDSGNEFEPSPDPLLPELLAQLAGIIPGREEDYRCKLTPLLSNSTLFGVDLYKAGLAERVAEYFTMMTGNPGAVRRTLEKILIKET